MNKTQPKRTGPGPQPSAQASCSAAELELALNASLNLQRHYAKLLNHWDGGKRFLFRDAEEWIARLRKVGTLPPNDKVSDGGPLTHESKQDANPPFAALTG